MELPSISSSPGASYTLSSEQVALVPEEPPVLLPMVLPTHELLQELSSPSPLRVDNPLVTICPIIVSVGKGVALCSGAVVALVGSIPSLIVQSVAFASTLLVSAIGGAIGGVSGLVVGVSQGKPFEHLQGGACLGLFIGSIVGSTVSLLLFSIPLLLSYGIYLVGEELLKIGDIPEDRMDLVSSPLFLMQEILLDNVQNYSGSLFLSLIAWGTGGIRLEDEGWR